jgi:5-oxoprolinase (ATP-hydrolysing) subunit A
MPDLLFHISFKLSQMSIDKRIDLNCDMGEGMGNDEEIMPWISSVNIACGYHAGDEQTIWQTVELAAEHKIAAGAHVSFLDKENFGRKAIEISPEEIYDLLTQQLIIIDEIIGSFEIKLHHVKPHGALYNLSAKDPAIARAIARAVRDFDAELILYGLSGSHSVSEAKSIALKTASEVFPDRRYEPDGSLTPRSVDGAVIQDTNKVIEHVLQMIQKGSVVSSSGKEVSLTPETICIHGDEKNAAILAKAIHECLKQQQVAIKAP